MIIVSQKQARKQHAQELVKAMFDDWFPDPLEDAVMDLVANRDEYRETMIETDEADHKLENLEVEEEIKLLSEVMVCFLREVTNAQAQLFARRAELNA